MQQLYTNCESVYSRRKKVTNIVISKFHKIIKVSLLLELKFQIQQARIEVESRGPPPHLIKRIKDLEEESRSIKLQMNEQQAEIDQLRQERNFLVEQSRFNSIFRRTYRNSTVAFKKMFFFRIHKKEINKAKQDLAEKHIEFINVKKDLTVAQRNIKKLNRRRGVLSASRNSTYKVSNFFTLGNWKTFI